MVVFFPHYCTREFNQFHLDLFESFKFGERKIRRVRAAPRGSAKSTITTLVGPLHDACYGTETFEIIVSSTQELAIPKLKDIRTEVLANTELQAVYGIHFRVKKPGAVSFTVYSDRGETHFRAAGKGAQIRGIRHGAKRPSKLIFDDFESSDEVQNDELRKKTEDIYHEEFGKTGDTDTNIEYVGTVIHKDALLPKLMDNPAYDAKKYKAVISWSEREDLWEAWRKIYRDLDNPARAKDAMKYYAANEFEMTKGTQVMWPEKESYLDHMKDLEEIGKRAFFKEKQNEPLGLDEPVFETIHWYREVETGLQIELTGHIVLWEHLIPIMTMDPSTGQNKRKANSRGDFCCLLTGFMDKKGRVFAHHDWTKRASPTKQIEAIFDLHEKYGHDKVGVETNLYRDLLLPIIMDEKRKREAKLGRPIMIRFYDINQTVNKHERIHTVEPKVNNGKLLFNRALSKEFTNQVDEFPNPKSHDDCPDALEMLWSLANNRYKPAALNINPMAGR